jgi:hydrogenase 3 maturation protease
LNDVSRFLARRLRGYERLAVLGVGSVLRSDDAAGMEVVRRLGESLCPVPPNVGLFAGETAPENLSGSIKRFAPTHLLVVDAADVGLNPGDCTDILPTSVGGPTFLSHMLPLKLMTDYLVLETGAAVTLLGVQYKTLAFDGPLSPEIERAVEKICDALKGIITLRNDAYQTR